MEFFWFVGIALVFAVVWGVLKGSQENKKNLTGEDALQKRFPDSQVHYFSDDKTFVLIDNRNKQVVLGRDKNEKIVNYSEIASVEVITDGTTISSTNRGSQLLGAAVGGLAFGGVGAIVGGLSGSSKTSVKVKKLSIRVIVDDNVNPIFNVTFFNWTGGGKGLDVKGDIIKPYIEKSEKFHALLTNTMRNAKKLESSDDLSMGSTEKLSKLWKLKEAGALTAQEYESEKKKLL